jgi:oligopeptide/dipeptide ABC transporter ATP-binding protein
MGILDVKDLCIYYRTLRGNVKAVDGVTFSIAEGESLGLVGESGCGKTTTGKALLRLLPENARIERGEILFRGRDLVRISLQEMRSIRGKDIAMVPQSAMNALDPVYRIKDLIIEGMLVHKEVAGEANEQRIKELFASVGLEGSRIDNYPHMFSGGMRQRAVIAGIFSLRPSLIIADEPTTALDVIVQDQVLKQLASLIRETRATLIAITHDIGIVAENCQKTGVMYAGKLVEIGPTEDVLVDSFHPYTMGLKNAFLGVRDERREIISIPGVPPSLIDPPHGCRFHPRCPFADATCSQKEPGLAEVSPGHFVACHYHRAAPEMRQVAKDPERWTQERGS